jgi:hypothetical protein
MARTFSLEINLENDAMSSSHELATVLRQVSKRIEDIDYLGRIEDELIRGIKDINGNTVGQWKLTKKD